MKTTYLFLIAVTLLCATTSVLSQESCSIKFFHALANGPNVDLLLVPAEGEPPAEPLATDISPGTSQVIDGIPCTGQTLRVLPTGAAEGEAPLLEEPLTLSVADGGIINYIVAAGIVDGTDEATAPRLLHQEVVAMTPQEAGTVSVGFWHVAPAVTPSPVTLQVFVDETPSQEGGINVELFQRTPENQNIPSASTVRVEVLDDQQQQLLNETLDVLAMDGGSFTVFLAGAEAMQLFVERDEAPASSGGSQSMSNDDFFDGATSFDGDDVVPPPEEESSSAAPPPPASSAASLDSLLLQLLA
ncbi:hypothetical protein QOT17_010974 [Balamuthia mandrillaris]